MRPLSLVAALVLAGCGDKSGDSASAVPEVAGRYQVFVTTVSGCDNDVSLIQPWAQGPLTVTQDGASVTLDYGDDALLLGTLDADGAFAASGELAWSGRDMALSQEGQFIQGAEAWELAARFRNVVSEDEFESNDCTLEADIEATRLSD
jgi:hypothetical protein